MPLLLQIRTTVSRENYDAVNLFLGQHFPHGWQEEPCQAGATEFILYLEKNKAAGQAVDTLRTSFPELSFTVTEEEDKQWGLAWRDFFTPVEAGGLFCVLPPWLVEQAPADSLCLIIEPRMAFGTGHHATTALCLEAIAALHHAGCLSPGQDFLDLGTGSGILGIACAMLGLYGFAVDTDPLAVENAFENCIVNSVADKITLSTGSLDVLPQARQFDLILANILAQPLVDMAKDIVPYLKPGGTLVLSGILKHQEKSVREAYQEAGLGAVKIMTREDPSAGTWVAITWTLQGA